MESARLLLLTAALVLASATRSQATVIQYELLNLAGPTWEYTYHVANDTLPGNIEELTIYFNLGLYENLMVTTPLFPAWDEIAVEPDPLIPDDGFYDALALLAPILPGTTQSGFSVKFDWLGTGTPGAQRFEIVDPESFAVLDSGLTSPIPEPSLFFFVAVGIAASCCGRRPRLR